jgi:hypothetical protein
LIPHRESLAKNVVSDTAVFMRPGTRVIHLGQGYSPETGYVDADQHAIPISPLQAGWAIRFLFLITGSWQRKSGTASSTSQPGPMAGIILDPADRGALLPKVVVSLATKKVRAYPCQLGMETIGQMSMTAGRTDLKRTMIRGSDPSLILRVTWNSGAFDTSLRSPPKVRWGRHRERLALPSRHWGARFKCWKVSLGSSFFAACHKGCA